MDLVGLQKHFPRLTDKNCRFTSPEDKKYNCLAWSVNVSDIWWEPDPGFSYYWPLGVERSYSLRAYREALRTKGFAPCNDDKQERGYQKIALYAKNDRPTHAAKQLPDGWWGSKLGRDVDIEHSLVALRGGAYGNVEMFLKKKLTSG